MLEELLALNVLAFMLVFARVGAAIAFMPGFSAAYVAVRIRLLFALALAFVMMPVLADRLPVPDLTPAAFTLLMLTEAVVGMFVGVIVRILLIALEAAGTFTSLFAALANALVQDPIAEQQSSTLAGFLSTMGLVLIFVTDLHHLMIRALMQTYVLFPVGDPIPVGDFADIAARTMADSFALGLQLATPFLIIALTYYIGLGILGRLMPQLPVFFFGLPIQISIQLWALAVTLSGIMLVFLSHFGDRMQAIFGV